MFSAEHEGLVCAFCSITQGAFTSAVINEPSLIPMALAQLFIQRMKSHEAEPMNAHAQLVQKLPLKFCA